MMRYPMKDAIKHIMTSLWWNREEAEKLAESCRKIALEGAIEYDEKEYKKEQKKQFRDFIAHKSGKRGRY
ncbi:hypothetical protein [Bacillus mycoides]|uniref:hypothetical protein n=1 Tax=Bacillus mycoides TaxID=1405 RepID=UPI00030E2D2B|nr:hypothetical protein [Bacillus mycoides]